MYLEDRKARRAKRLHDLANAWWNVSQLMKNGAAYANGTPGSCSLDQTRSSTNDLDPGAVSRSALLWLRLVAGVDDELYALAVLDLIDHLDLVHHSDVIRWEHAHSYALVAAAVAALQSEAIAEATS